MDECNTTVMTFILNTYYSHRADTFNMYTEYFLCCECFHCNYFIYLFI